MLQNAYLLAKSEPIQPQTSNILPKFCQPTLSDVQRILFTNGAACPTRSLPCPQNRQAHLADVSARCSANTKRANPRRNTTTQRRSRSSCSDAMRYARVVQVCNPIGQDLSPRDSSKMFLGTILRLLSNVKHVNKYCKSGTGNWKLELEIGPCRSCTSWDGSEPQL